MTSTIPLTKLSNGGRSISFMDNKVWEEPSARRVV
jgi:hypothetical protein